METRSESVDLGERERGDRPEQPEAGAPAHAAIRTISAGPATPPALRRNEVVAATLDPQGECTVRGRRNACDLHPVPHLGLALEHRVRDASREAAR